MIGKVTLLDNSVSNQSNKPRLQHPCAICGKSFPHHSLISAAAIRDVIQKEIIQSVPTWSGASFICLADLNRFRAKYVHSLLQSDKGEITSLEKEVLSSLEEQELLSKNIELDVDEKWSVGQRLADRVARFGGSWTFLLSFAAFVVLWIGVNSVVLYSRPPDPYPYILLNLLLSCLAAIQAPVILMSQNRQEAKDRLRSQHDYQVNLKAELEIRHLHEKIDHLLIHQWDRLAEIQEIQLELLSELGRRG